MKKNFFIIGVVILGAGACASGTNKPKMASARYGMAQQLMERGEATQALSELLEAEKLDPQNADVQNLLGLVFAGRNMLPEAEEHLQRAVKSRPDFSEAHNHLCYVQIQRAEYESAVKSCEKAVSNVTYGTPERAYHNMGAAYEKLGNDVKAIESYRKGLAFNGNFVMSRNALGQLYSKNGKTKEAFAEFETAKKACDVTPPGGWGVQCAETYYQLAMGYLKTRQRTKAEAALKDCVKTDEQGAYGEKCRKSLRVLQ